MSEEIKFRYLLDSAVLVCCGDHKLLVDGIVSDRQKFDLMDQETEDRLIRRKPPFDGLEYLLFTHCHADHYSRSKTLKFLERNRDVRLFLPVNGGISERLTGFLGSWMFPVSGAEGEVLSYRFGDMLIEYMKIDHLTFDYPEHYCINIVTESESMAFTADMDFNRMELLKKFTKRKRSTIFINHLDMLHRKWRNALKELDYDRIFFYHLPSEEADGFGYRDRALRNWTKYKEFFSNACLLTYENRHR